MTTTLLTASQMCKSFGGVHAVRDVDISFTEGEIVGIIGPNGSGKSTLFGLLTGFIRPSSGRVEWLGQDISSMPSYTRAGLGISRTFQERMVFDGMSVLENLEFSLVQAGRRRKERALITDVLDLVGLPQGVLKQDAGDLSWGQTRLLGIAMAVLLKPRLLLLDEPFAGLNRLAAQPVVEALRRLQQNGLTLVVIDHEMQLLLPLADRIVVMADGEAIAEGQAADILQRPEVRLAYFGNSSHTGGSDVSAS